MKPAPFAYFRAQTLDDAFEVLADCGGGVVQGLGATLWEGCVYDDAGQLLNANTADYLVPMAAELPDIVCGHVESPIAESDLGANTRGALGNRARRSARTLASCRSHPHSMSGAAHTARTDGHHPCLTTHVPTFEILHSTNHLDVQVC